MRERSSITVANYTLQRHRAHPQGRTSYRIPGVAGNLVIFNKLFMGQPPEQLVLNVPVQSPVVVPSAAVRKATRALERATQAQERLQLAKARLASHHIVRDPLPKAVAT